MSDKIATVSKFTGLTEDETKRFVGCLLAVGLEITESERIAKLEALVRDAAEELSYVQEAPTLELAKSSIGLAIICRADNLLTSPAGEKGE